MHAAALLAAHEAFGFGHDRALRLMREIDQKVCYTIQTGEIAEEVMEKLGIKLVFSDPLERVREAGQDG